VSAAISALVASLIAILLRNEYRSLIMNAPACKAPDYIARCFSLAIRRRQLQAANRTFNRVALLSKTPTVRNG
jgi:hypothetical protein